jgi:soluble lytic murein transglycosylase-like protein
MRNSLFSIFVISIFLLINTVQAGSYDIDYDKAENLCNKICKNKNTDIREITELIGHYSSFTDINPNTILALGVIESNLNSKAIGPGKYSQGIMQVNIRYHRNKFKKTPLDLDDNIRVGIGIYSDCVRKHKGDLEKSIFCYRGIKDNTYINKIKKFRDYAIFRST